MYIVAYDITDNKERKTVSKKIEKYGERIQKSVWICDITSTECKKLRSSLEDLSIESGNIHIWFAQNEPWKIGDPDKMPVRAFVHFM